jgi:hypothetical protein
MKAREAARQAATKAVTGDIAGAKVAAADMAGHLKDKFTLVGGKMIRIASGNRRDDNNG